MSTKPEKEYSKEVLEIAERISFEPEAVAKARSLSAAELKTLTETYLEEVHQSPSYWRLLPARDLATPYLIAAFERENPFKKNDKSSVPLNSPAVRALAFLDSGVHPELKAHLLRWLKTGDMAVYRVIATPLVAFGSDDLLPHVKVLFEHPDMIQSGHARGGALNAFKGGRAEPGFRKYVWDHARELLQAAKPPSSYDPIRLLVAIDKEATKQVLLDPAVMRRDHPLLAEALGTLNQLQSPPDAEFLNSLIADDTLAPDYRKVGIHKAALSGLIARHDPTASAYVERILAAPDRFSETMVQAAWGGRFKINGLTPVYDTAFDAYEKAGNKVESLSPDDRDIILMQYLGAEVQNGGFAQWYGNDYGRFAVETRDALKKIGATKHAEIVEAANRTFGWGGPPKSREQLEKALDGMSEKNAQKLGELGDAWDKLPYWGLNGAAWDWERQSKSLPKEGAGQPAAGSKSH